MQEVGYVISSRDYLIYLDGLPTVKIFDLVENEQGIKAVISALSADKVEAWVLSEGDVLPGQLFKRLDYRLNLSVSSSLLGRSINPMGVAIDGKGPLAKTSSTTLELEGQPSGIQTRQFIDQQFVTGVMLIDTLIPIGKGQRELVVGDSHSGKTSFLIDVIANQAQTGIICVFASIGKPISELRSSLDTLKATKALDHTVVVAASSTDPSPLIFFTPHAALSVAEFFQRQGKDVLVILDDMGTHAKIYRELSLLGSRPPGRESYPGDIFFSQAHLMERSGRFNPSAGSGSITALPVMEINLSDFTTFIPTNLMGMTDGHLLFKAVLRSQGQRPAIDIAQSVSRVGRQTQPRIINLLSQRIRQVFAQGEELETVSRFASELPEQTQAILRQRELLEEMLKQDYLTFIPLDTQLALLGLIFTAVMQDKNGLYIAKNKKALLDFLLNPKMRSFTKGLLALQNLNQLGEELEKLTPKLKP